MRKGMLAVISGGFGSVMMVLFGLCIAWQCAPVQAAQTDAPAPLPLAFPLTVTGTELTALQIADYEGPFWEDGSRDEVVRVAALLVENTGDMMISRGAVVLQWETEMMVFELFMLPPGQRVLVLEKDRQLRREGVPSQCYGWTSREYNENMGQVTVEELGGMTLAVVNRTADVIPVTTICYKTRDSASGIYIGGIAYTLEVRQLQPGERRLLVPENYAYGHSRILSINTWVEE